MSITSERCIKMKKITDKIRNNLGDNLDNPIFRNNYLEIGIDNFDNEEDKLLFRSLITFYDPEIFLKHYKDTNKDINKIAEIYLTDKVLVEFYIKVIKNLSK